MPRVPPSVERARKLRREMSYPEVLLWQRLRGSPTGVRFRRQHPIGPDYIADFCSLAAKLAIEVDGASHDYSVEGDAVRDRYFAEHGWRVLRIPAADVLRNADHVADAIVSLAAKPLHQPAAGPPPRAGEDQGS